MVDRTEERLRSLMMNSAQPQEGSLKPNHEETRDYRDVRDVFPTDEEDLNGTTAVENTKAQCEEAASVSFNTPQEFRQAVRSGQFTGPTNGVCPGYMQCNLVVLEEGQESSNFLLFCQRNKKACPLIEVCDVGNPSAEAIAAGSDLRTDIPKYRIYRNGKFDEEVEDVRPYWTEKSVAFDWV